MLSKERIKEKFIKSYQVALKKFWKGQHADALSSFEQLRDGNGTQIELVDSLRTYIEACKIKLGLNAFEPKTPEDHYLFGVMLMNEGDYEESVRHLSHAVSKNKNNDAWQFSIACALALNENIPEAAEALSKAIELNPDNKIYAMNIDDLNSLKEDESYSDLFSEQVLQ